MNKNIIISLADIPKRKKAPTELKLFGWGVNKTTKGEFVLTKESADLIIQAWKDYGNKLNVDYNHAQLTSENPDDAISAGTFDLKLTDKGLFAVNILWTDKAKAMIEAKEYIYTSPAFLVNDDSDIVEILNFALTNMPATIGMEQLIAASKQHIMEKIMADKQIEEEVPVEELAVEDVPADAPAFDAEAKYAELESTYNELKAEVEMLKEAVAKLVGEEIDEEVPPVEAAAEAPVEAPVDEEKLALKKENDIYKAIMAKKALPSEMDKLKALGLNELDKELKSRVQINLTSSKQIVDTSVALSVDKSADEAFRASLRKQLKL